MVRYKSRYLLLEWKFSSVEVGRRALQGESTRKLQSFLKDQVQAFYGDYGVACVQQSLTIKYHNFLTSITIVRCPRSGYRPVWAALSGVTSYKKEPCTLSLLHLAGTIQSSQKHLLKHNRMALRKVHSRN